jgi:hypothetical protein
LPQHGVNSPKHADETPSPRPSSLNHFADLHS